jgi:hypothetical protein
MCTTIYLLFILLTTQTYAQEFQVDGSMKLTEVSTDKRYGYEPNHETSIKVGSIDNEVAYLKALRGPKGENIQYTKFLVAVNIVLHLQKTGRAF